jgi:3D (Asp-Asp-Asp) domain-containing protein
MGFDITTIQKVAVEAINEYALQVMFGKVTSVKPLVVKIGNNLTITEEFIVLDTPVDINEEVIVMQYSTGNKYLVLSTVEKVYPSSVHLGGVVNEGYTTDGKWKSIGKFKITHYCCEKYPHICNAGPPYKTATGTTPHVGGCAVDPKKIPLGSYIKINGVVYHAEDTGGAIKGNRIDVVVGTHKEALSKGTYNAEVFLKVGD